MEAVEARSRLLHPLDTEGGGKRRKTEETGEERVGIGEKRHGYFTLSAFRSISFVHALEARAHRA